MMELGSPAGALLFGILLRAIFLLDVGGHII